ncbi:MAG: TRAM domain-containing protein [Alphaproteobacteria bacterium]|nr:TRAM domain-containing protein [Alphaproteobacteria bacterium]
MQKAVSRRISNQIVTSEIVKIYSLNVSGEGVGDQDGKEIFVPFALPGEKVAIEIHEFRRKKKFVLKQVLEASPNRIQPVCSHFTQCGGCTLQHFDAITYKDFKKSLITQPLLEYGLDPFLVGDLVILPFGRRRRANLDAIKKEDKVHLGFHRWRAHQIIDIQECHTLAPELRVLIAPFRQALDTILTPFQKAKIFLTVTKGGVDFSLEIQGVLELSNDQKDVLMQFAQAMNLARFIFRHGKKVEVLHLSADPVIEFDGVDVAVDAYGFLQATDDADRALSQIIMDAIPTGVRKIADLFAGRGTFSLPLSRLAPVDAFELDKPALAALDGAIALSGRPITTHYRNLYDNPLLSDELQSYDVIVLDPPRAGALEQIEQIKSLSVQTLIYISCNPQTFCRDAKILIDNGYVLKTITPIDQFAWSAHLEVVGIFLLA